MTKLSMLPVSLLLLAGVAHAQAPKADKQPPPAEKKMPPEAKPVEAKPPEMPKPSQEIADAIKAMSGTWKCTGKAEIGTQMVDIKATISMKTDLNGYWMQTNFNAAMGKLPPFKFTAFTSYDETNKKFYRMQMTSHGGHSTSWGTMADKKLSWEGDARWMGNDVKVKETEEMVGPKEVHVAGEYSKDGGKTWNKDHEAICKK